MLPRMAICIVSYVDTGGVRHTVEVNADSLYEGAVLADAYVQKTRLRAWPNKST